MTHINLIVALEEEFDVFLSAEEAASVVDVGELMGLLDSKMS